MRAMRVPDLDGGLVCGEDNGIIIDGQNAERLADLVAQSVRDIVEANETKMSARPGETIRVTWNLTVGKKRSKVICQLKVFGAETG